MRRRDFIAGVGASVWSFGLRAQSQAPVIGFLRSTWPPDAKLLANAFRQGLSETGFVEGQNVAIEYHSAEGQPDRLRTLAADLVRRPVSLIAGNIIAMVAAKDATKTIPVVFVGGADPIRLGLVASLNRPGGNVTGVSFFAGALGTKRLELLLQVAPGARTVGMLVHPGTVETEAERNEVQAAARALGRELVVVDVKSRGEIEAAFSRFGQRDVRALFCGSGPFLSLHRELVVALAARHALPATYSLRRSVEMGGLMSYGTSQPDAYRQAGIYAARILKGEKPADLPVIRASKFDMVLNLKTAKALGLNIPDRVLALADDVIE